MLQNKEILTIRKRYLKATAQRSAGNLYTYDLKFNAEKMFFDISIWVRFYTIFKNLCYLIFC